MGPVLHVLDSRGMEVLFELVSVQLGDLGQPHPAAVLGQKLLEQPLGVADLGSR